MFLDAKREAREGHKDGKKVPFETSRFLFDSLNLKSNGLGRNERKIEMGEGKEEKERLGLLSWEE